jgi:hypothetical protein
MGIEMSYGSLDDIPEMSVKELFTENEGKMVFTGIEGIKTGDDVSKLEEALRKERNDHSGTKGKLKVFEGYDIDSIKNALSENEILKTQLKEGQSTEELQNLVKTRVDAQLKDITEENNLLKKENEAFKLKETNYNKSETLSKELSGKIDESFVPSVKKLLFNELVLQADGSLMTDDNSEYGAGLTAESLVKKFVDSNPQFAPRNTGGGAKGGDTNGATSDNPWSKNNFNRTEQHKIMKNDPAKAKKLQELAKKE